MPEIITPDGEVIETGVALTEQMSLAIGLTKAEIDQQIATAHAFPRSIAKATQNILSLVTMDEQSAEECNYALPRGGKPITGPSIRLAEIVAGQWGNQRNGARVVHVDRAEKYVEAEGVFHDLETNSASTARVRRRIVDSKGRLYSDDMIIVTGNAACSIAKRNAILGGVPKAVWRKAYEAALATIKGDVKTLSERREKMLKAFAAFGVKPDMIFASLEIGGIDDINLEHIATLTGMHSALKSGEETVESMFSSAIKPDGAAAGKQGLKDKLNDVANGGAKGKADDGKDKGGDKPADPPKGKNGGQGNGDGKPTADDDFPGDRPSQSQGQGGGKPDPEKSTEPAAEPTGDEIEAAKDRGAEAFHRGMARRAVPPEYREFPALVQGWQAGYDAARADEEAGQNGGEA